MEDSNVMDLMEATERLEAVASALEQAAARLAERQVALAAEAEEHVGRIVATVETAREAELERRLAEAEAKIAELTASAAPRGAGSQDLAVGNGDDARKAGRDAGAGCVRCIDWSVPRLIARWRAWGSSSVSR